MAELNNFTPSWNYVADDYEDSSLSDIHLILWSKGICVVSYNSEGNPIAVQTYLTREMPDKIWVEALNEKHHLLKDKDSMVSKIWLSDERNILTPNRLFNDNHAEEWLKKLHHLQKDESIIHFNLDGLIDATLSSPIQQSLKDYFNSQYTNAHIEPLSIAAFPDDKNENGLFIKMICLPGEVTYTIFQNGELLYHLTSEYEQARNIVYKLSLFLNENGFEQNAISKISFSGVAPYWHKIIEELANFFPVEIYSKDNKESTLAFFKNLYQCA